MMLTCVTALCCGLGLWSLAAAAPGPRLPSSLGAGRMLLSQVEAVITCTVRRMCFGVSSQWCDATWLPSPAPAWALPRPLPGAAATSWFSLSLSCRSPLCCGKWTLWGRVLARSRSALCLPRPWR